MTTTMTGLTQTAYTTGSMMTEPLVGNCSNHPDPDLWQPEPEQTGRPTSRMMGRLTERVLIAKTICSTCPSKDRCLDIGNQPDDLAYGIWGGKMAGERILDLGYKRDELARQSELGKAIDFYERLKPHIERLQNV